MTLRLFAIYSVVFLPSIPSLPGRVGPGTTDQAAGTHGLVPDATPPVPAVLNTVRAVMSQGGLQHQRGLETDSAHKFHTAEN